MIFFQILKCYRKHFQYDNDFFFKIPKINISYSLQKILFDPQVILGIEQTSFISRIIFEESVPFSSTRSRDEYAM